MGVAQPILASLVYGSPAGRRVREPIEFLDRTIPLPFQVHADAAVEWELGKVVADIRNPRLDDSGQHLVRLLVVRDPYPCWFVRREVQNTLGKVLVAEVGRNLDELVDFTAVTIFHRYARRLPGRLLVVWVIGVCIFDQLVEPVVEGTVLCLLTRKREVSTCKYLKHQKGLGCNHVSYAYLGHATTECKALTENALGLDRQSHAHVVLLVYQSAQLRLDLELDASGRHLVEVGRQDDMVEQEVCNRVDDAVWRNGVGDAWFPVPKRSAEIVYAEWIWWRDA